MRITPAVIALLAVLIGGDPSAWGQGVGGSSPTNTVHPLIPGEISIPEDPVHWKGDVGSEAASIGIELAPDGSVWSKTFQRSGTRLFQFGQVVEIKEYLMVQGDLAWTGWSTRIDTSDFGWWSPSWGFVQTESGALVPGLQRSIDGPGMSFTFDPLTPGTRVELSLRLTCTGTVPFDGTLHLSQYPTPEPAPALLLMSLFVLTPLRRR